MTLSQKQIIQRRYKNLTPEYAKTIVKEFREQWPEVAKYYKIIKRNITNKQKRNINEGCI